MKAILVLADNTRVEVDNVPDDAGVIIRQDTRCKTPIRVFAFRGDAYAGPKPFFEEVRHHYLDPKSTPEALNDWTDE